MIDIDLTNYISNLEVDKTIAVFKGSLLIPAGGSNQVDHTLPVGAGHTFWEGTYTLDSQTQQNDIGGLQYSGLRGAGLEARSYVGGIRVRGVNTTGSNVTAHYNLSVIASPETTVIPSSGTFPALENPIAFDSRENHRKIIKTRTWPQGTDAISVNGTFLKVVLKGDDSILASTQRVKVFVILSDGFMYDMSTTYGRTMVSLAGGEVIATIANIVTVTGAEKGFVRYYYE